MASKSVANKFQFEKCRNRTLNRYELASWGGLLAKQNIPEKRTMPTCASMNKQAPKYPKGYPQDSKNAFTIARKIQLFEKMSNIFFPEKVSMPKIRKRDL